MYHGQKMMNAMQLIAYKFQSKKARQKFRSNQVAVDMFEALLQDKEENPNPHMQSAVVAACMAQNATDNENTVLHYIAQGSSAKRVGKIAEMLVRACGSDILLVPNGDGQTPLGVASGEVREALLKFYENSEAASVRASATEVAFEQAWGTEVAPPQPQYSLEVSNVSHKPISEEQRLWDARPRMELQKGMCRL